MICYAMLCYAMLCYAMLCYAMLCYAMLCYAMLCYAMLCYAMLCNAMLCYAMLCYAMLYNVLELYHFVLWQQQRERAGAGSSVYALYSAEEVGQIRCENNSSVLNAY